MLMRFAIPLLASAFISSPLAAQEARWYGGASFGQSKADIDEAGSSAALAADGFANTGFTSDESDSGFKLFVGHRFNRNFAVEGSFVMLGEVSATTTVTNLTTPRATEFRVEWKNGFSLAAIGIAPLGERFSVFGKGGFYYAKTSASTSIQAFGSGSESDSNAGPLLGAGLTFDVARNVAVRAEWERFFDVGGDHTGGEGDFDFMSLGLMFRF
jgi:OOP family OmpA-OmpF porin